MNRILIAKQVPLLNHPTYLSLSNRLCSFSFAGHRNYHGTLLRQHQTMTTCPSFFYLKSNTDVSSMSFKTSLFQLKFKSNMSSLSSSSSSTSSIQSTPKILDYIQEQIQSGTLVKDEQQIKAAKRLANLQEKLIGYDDQCMKDTVPITSKKEEDKEESQTPNSHQGQNDLQAEKVKQDKQPLNQQQISHLPIPRGLFLHGEVGTGKSLLMDVFYQTTPMQKKRRIHFHSFLQEIHQQIHKLKQSDLKTKGRNFHIDINVQNNPIYRVATQLSSNMKLLCLDEFQVTDVADALILSQLFSVLWANGVVVVATSNRPPQDLYEGGLNRSYFLPFIDLLKRYCLVVNMNSHQDYRRLLVADGGKDDFFFVQQRQETGKGDSRKNYNDIFQQIIQEKIGDLEKDFSNVNNVEKILEELPPRTLNIGYGRTLDIKHGNSKDNLVCRFTFDELCHVELGSSDYNAIASQFKIIMLEEIPLLTLKEHDQARRFITLIDELYEGKCCLMCLAIAGPDDLFVDHTKTIPSSSTSTEQQDDIETKVGEMFGIDVAQSNGKTIGELASVRELSFAFRRASSRLVEMTSKAWWEKHSGL